MKRITSAALAIGLLALASPLVEAADAKKRLGRYYGGVTAQGMPFVLELARGSKAVDSASLIVGGACANSPGVRYFFRLSFEVDVPAFVPPGDHVVSPGKVSKSGKFRANGIGVEYFGTATGAIVESVSGKLRRNGSAAGTYEADVTMIDDNGVTVDTCHTGTVKWTARSRRGRVYAGTTSQAMPVVLELNSQRNLVEMVRFGWGATCTPEGALLFPDELTDFRLTAGEFGDAFQVPVDLDGGGKATVDYDVKGRVASSTSASGSASVKLTETDAAGAVTSSCDTGSFSWTARSG